VTDLHALGWRAFIAKAGGAKAPASANLSRGKTVLPRSAHFDARSTQARGFLEIGPTDRT